MEQLIQTITLSPIVGEENIVRSRSSGSVLLLSLWILAFFGLVAASLSFRTRIALRLTESQWREIQSEQLAKMAVCLAQGTWAKQATRYAALNQAWSHNPDLFKDHAVGEGMFTVYRKALDDNNLEQTFYGMEDESGKINVNRAPEEVLRRLFGVHAEVVPAVLDWRSQSPLRRPGGAKGNDYDHLGYTCRNGALRSLEELRLVKGMTPELFRDVQGSLTVYGRGVVNINTASARVMGALGLSDSLVRKILSFRIGSDGIPGTPDDGVFSNVGMIILLLKQKTSLSNDELQALSRIIRQNRLGVEPQAFQIRVLTRLNSGHWEGRFSIVMSARTKGMRLLDWREAGL
jgi:type II secretory pathway component PulK